MEYILHLLVIVCIYSILAISVDLIAGHTGLVSLAQAAFFGVGAYTSALLAVRLGSSFAMGVLCGMVLSLLVSLLVSIPSLRMRDDYFVICTFGFQMILFSTYNNWSSLTGGPLGIMNIPQASIFGLVIRSRLEFLVIALCATVVAHVVFRQIVTSPYGRVLHSIREDEVFSEALGKDVLFFKVTAFATSCTLAALGGSLYAHYVTYIDPTSFTVTESILVISMVIIGGAGSIWGPPLGAAILVLIPEILRFLGLPSSLAANGRQILYGSLLVLMMMLRPRGLVGNYRFGGK